MNTNTSRIAKIALFAALMAVLSQISFALGPIPFSCGILGALLCGLMQNPRDAVLSILVYLLLGAVGLPVFAGMSGGLQVIAGMTGGYLVGYLLIAWITAVAVHSLPAYAASLRMPITVLAELIGVAACYTLGTLWFMFISGSALSVALSACVFPFLPGDFLKIAAAYFLSLLLKRRLSLAGIRLA